MRIPGRDLWTRPKSSKVSTETDSGAAEEMLKSARACHRLPGWRNEILDGDWGAPYSDPGFEVAQDRWCRYVMMYLCLKIEDQQHQWLSLREEEREYLQNEWGIKEPTS